MSTTWILVANASLAKLYANHGPKKGLKLLHEMQHPESRERAAELVADRPGHGVGGGHGSFVPATDPKRNEADRFAQEVSRHIEQGRTANSFERLIVVASAPFMGKLNNHLPSPVRNMVSDSIEKDYTRSNERELSGHLEHCIFL
jgi:protein required for attachment to host cells